MKVIIDTNNEDDKLAYWAVKNASELYSLVHEIDSNLYRKYIKHAPDDILDEAYDMAVDIVDHIRGFAFRIDTEDIL